MAMEDADLESCTDLLLRRRWAALATTGDREPLASMVAFVLDEGPSGVLMHLSTLAAHTRNLQESGRASLVVSQPDTGEGDPQELARLTLTGPVTAVAAGDEGYASAAARYLERFPAAEPRFAFGDFGLYRLEPDRVNFVGGFARARNLQGQSFLAALARHSAFNVASGRSE